MVEIFFFSVRARTRHRCFGTSSSTIFLSFSVVRFCVIDRDPLSFVLSNSRVSSDKNRSESSNTIETETDRRAHESSHWTSSKQSAAFSKLTLALPKALSLQLLVDGVRHRDHNNHVARRSASRDNAPVTAPLDVTAGDGGDVAYG